MTQLRKSIFYLVLVTLAMTVSTNAFSLCAFDPVVKVSAFFPTSKKICRIYSSVMPYYELEINKNFCENWQFWLGGGYVSDRGKALGCKTKTSMWLVPLSTGLKYLYPLNQCLNLYAGAGACYSLFHTKDSSRYVHKNNFQDTLGGIFKLGCFFNLTGQLFGDVSLEYLYQRFSFSHHSSRHYTLRHHVDMSGFKIGGGIGCRY